MRILVIEDDRRVATSVAAHLRSQQYVIDIAGDGQAGLDYALGSPYELVLIDVMLPVIDGITVCRKLRAANANVAIMMLTARDRVGDKVEALDAGADDYLAKPFALAELSARIRALARRSQERKPAVLRHGRLELDRATAVAVYGDTTLSLTRTEFSILETLMRSPKQVFSGEMLLERVAADERATPGSMKSHMANLRRKLRAAGCRRSPIETHYGFGYRLADIT
jgi:two-component system, OmpR family, response regulator QseB